MLDVAEIFYSIQGESTFAGCPCIFIRLSGCNLRCSYCDAKYTYEESGIATSIDEIVSRIQKFDCSLVEITGGEPLLQSDVLLLFSALEERGYTILLETNGALPIERVPADVCIIMDIKCPDSGSADSLYLPNIDFLKQRSVNRVQASDQIKFVISSRQDFLWSRDFLRTRELNRFCEILFSPALGTIEPDWLADMILADHLPVRLQLQLHALLWPGTLRGK